MANEHFSFSKFTGAVFSTSSWSTLHRRLNQMIESLTTAFDGMPTDAQITALGRIPEAAPADGEVMVGDGTTYVLESDATLRTSLGLGAGNDVSFRGVQTTRTSGDPNANPIVALNNDAGSSCGYFLAASYSDTDGAGYTIFKSRGTQASPTKVTSGTHLGGLSAHGVYNTSGQSGLAATIGFYAAQDFSSGNYATDVVIGNPNEVARLYGLTGNFGVTNAIELGHATDTTLARSGAGEITIEGNQVFHAGNSAQFTTADETKLDGIDAGADVTGTANVRAAGAVMDDELTDIAAVKALDQGVAEADMPTFADINVAGQSFTPVIEGTTTAGVGTYFGGSTKGWFVEINGWCEFVLKIATSTHTGTGNMLVTGTGLPVSDSSIGIDHPVQVLPSSVTYGAKDGVVGLVHKGTNEIHLYTYANNAAKAALAMDVGVELHITGRYRT